MKLVLNICLDLLISIYFATGFNISPKPNMVFRYPNQNPNISSYFGFTINLRESSLFVGAPRAQKIGTKREFGAIYKCSIKTQNCDFVQIDKKLNFVKNSEQNNIDAIKIKDHQWLGSSMDGGNRDTDKLVVCSPRLEAEWNDSQFVVANPIHGICYWTSNTISSINKTLFNEISPLREHIKQYKVHKGNNRFDYIFGQQGISVHVTSDGQEILMGAPGIDTWKGSVIRYHNQTDRNFDWTTEIPSPELWKQSDDSYFGYSVGSGYFDSALPNKIYYLASAPQANNQSGEAYIFDIIIDGKQHSIVKYFTFRGSQFGEYFGYAVLAEDFNNDGLTDVIVTAPQYSSGGHVEQGAMYVFINKGKFVFELQKKIISPVEGRGRFGSSISKLGDINRDGFNDIAVGAPFAGNGTVFIYLGSSKGLREVHSQKLEAGPVANSWGSPMFGHGLSKGSDIDNNGFNDFAIGDPNAELVFLYRAYPVVQIHATINSSKQAFKPEHTKFQIEICYMISTKSEKIKNQELTINVNVDPRITLYLTNSFKLSFNVSATTQEECRLFDAIVTYTPAGIYNPMKLEMFYKLKNIIPNSKEFCDNCTAVDPADPKSCSKKISFNTQCFSDFCIADLKVTSSGLPLTYILGSSRTMSVTYDITNNGEAAYLPRINITSSNKMPFAKLPSSCNQHDCFLLCDLTEAQPIMPKGKQKITIVYDVSRIEGSSITLTAEVSSNGKENNPSDNIVKDFIILREFTEIEAIGKPLTSHINLEEVFHSAEIINRYEVKTSGPSKIQELDIILHIPIAHKFYGSIEPVPVVNVTNITVQGTYNSQVLNVKIYQDNTMLLLNASELLMSSIVAPNEVWNENQEVPKNLSEELGKKTDVFSERLQRRRRSFDQQKLSNDNFKVVQKKSYELLSFEQMESLPTTRTVVFSCVDPETTTCARAVIRVNNFIPDMPITVTLKYLIDLDEVNKIMIVPLESFVVLTKLEIVKVGDTFGNSTHVQSKMEYNVISKRQLYSAPLWLIMLAISGGLLVLTAITYGMYRTGFFRRKTKEAMEILVQVQRATEDIEDEGL